MVLWFLSAGAKGSIVAGLKRAHGVTCPSCLDVQREPGPDCCRGLSSSCAGLMMASAWAEGFQPQPTSRRLITAPRGGGPADSPRISPGCVPPLQVPSSHVMFAAT